MRSVPLPSNKITRLKSTFCRAIFSVHPQRWRSTGRGESLSDIISSYTRARASQELT